MYLFVIIYYKKTDEDAPTGKFFIYEQAEIKAQRRFCKITDNTIACISEIRRVKQQWA